MTIHTFSSAKTSGMKFLNLHLMIHPVQKHLSRDGTSEPKSHHFYRVNFPVVLDESDAEREIFFE